MANILYQTSNADQYHDLRQKNSVRAIGHVACALKDIGDVTHSALTILQQRFHHPPSLLDGIIAAEFAQILLTGVVSLKYIIFS